MTEHHTVCNRDCPDACGILATVEDGRVTRLRGDPHHPVTKGFLCYRTGQFLGNQYSPNRVLTPLIRTNGSLTPASWDEALDRIAHRLLSIRAESGPAAIFHYRSGGSLRVLLGLTEAFFDAFGPVTTKSGDICSGAGDAAQLADFGDEDSNDLHDLVNAKHILVWGKNVFVSSPHTIPVLKAAAKAGTKLTLIDPVWHRTAELCQSYVQPRPGGDFALAMAVALELQRLDAVRGANRCDNVDAFWAMAHARSAEAWCQTADVSLVMATHIATALADGPTAILVGWGMGRRAYGGATVRALDALCALSGNLGVAGGGASFYFKRRGAFQKPFPSPTPPRQINEIRFGEELAASDIRFVWITAGNPVAMLPDSHAVRASLNSREFVVVVDTWLSDTTEVADVVLPTTTLLEADDLLGAYGHHYIGEARPVVPPPQEVRSDLQIIQDLAPRVGLGDRFAGSAAYWKSRFLRPELAHTDLSRPIRNPLTPKIAFENHVPTASGRVNLITQAPPEPVVGVVLCSLSTEHSQSSVWAHEPEGPAVLTLHPDLAPVPDGALARLRSDVGEMTVRLRYDARQRKDLVIVPKGGHLRDGRCANALVGAKLTDIGQGGVLYDTVVSVLPMPE